VLVFFCVTLVFTFGNIENSKGMQVVVSGLRAFVIFLFFVGTFYSLLINGVTAKSWFGSE